MSDLIKTEFPYDRMNLTCLYKIRILILFM